MNTAASQRKENIVRIDIRVELEAGDHGVKVAAYKNGALDASYAWTDLDRALYIARCHLKGSEPSKRRLLTGKGLR